MYGYNRCLPKHNHPKFRFSLFGEEKLNTLKCFFVLPSHLRQTVLVWVSLVVMIYISPFCRLSVRRKQRVENKSERRIGRAKSPQYPGLPSISCRARHNIRSSRPAENLEYVRFMPSLQTLQCGLSNLEDTTIKFNQRNEGMVISSISPCI